MREVPLTLSLKNCWAFGPAQDLSFILATPVAIFLIFAVAERGGWLDALLFFALVSAMGHYLPGILRAYGDRALFRRYRTRLVVVPALLFAFTTALAYFNFTFVFLIVGLWGSWHWTMQVYGFARIYDAKAPASTPALLDKALCLLWFGVCVFVLNDALAVYVTTFYESGGALLPTTGVRWFTQAWLAVTIALTVFYLAYMVVWVRGGARLNPLKWLFLAGTFVYLAYTASKIERPVVGYAMFEMWHDAQYLAIVWLFNLSRARRNPEAGAFIRFLFRPKAVPALAYVGLCLAFGMLTHAWHLFQDAAAIRVASSIVLATAMLHYYLDGFIWRIREPETRAALGMASTGTPGSTREKPMPAAFLQQLRHAALWLLVVVPAGVLFALESKSSAAPPAVVVYENLVETFPNSAKAHYELGRELQESGRLMEGKVHLERALSLKPKFYSAIVRLGALLSDQQNFGEARPYLERAVQMNPSDVEARNNLAVALDELGDTREARSHLEVVLRLDPRYALAHSNLGIVLSRQGDLPGAVRHFQEALKLDPQNAPTLNNLGEVLLKLGKNNDAKANFERALRLEPGFRKAQQNLSTLEQP